MEEEKKSYEVEEIKIEDCNVFDDGDVKIIPV
jgi:hypothetical protein